MGVPTSARLGEHHRGTLPTQHLTPELPLVPEAEGDEGGYTPEPPAGGRRAGGGCAASRVRWEAGVAASWALRTLRVHLLWKTFPCSFIDQRQMLDQHRSHPGCSVVGPFSPRQ